MTGAPIFAGFVLLATLLCWLLIYARGHWAIKTVGTISVLAFSFAVWHAVGSYSGWPARLTPPEKSVFVSGLVRDPNPATGDKGAIILWLIPRTRSHTVLGYDPAADEPRAYRLPYTEELHKEVMDAQHLQKSHGLVGFDKRHKKSGAKRGGNMRRRGDYMPYVLPTPKPTRKEGQ